MNVAQKERAGIDTVPRELQRHALNGPFAVLDGAEERTWICKSVGQ